MPFLGEYLNSFTMTPEMVHDKLHDLNPEKPPGPGWHSILLKNPSFPLSVLLQKLLNDGKVSLKWLKACITVIHNKTVGNATLEPLGR